jgi:hypothetical protein
MNMMHAILAVGAGCYVLSYSIGGWAKSMGPWFGLGLFVLLGASAVEFYGK